MVFLGSISKNHTGVESVVGRQPRCRRPILEDWSPYGHVRSTVRSQIDAVAKGRGDVVPRKRSAVFLAQFRQVWWLLVQVGRDRLIIGVESDHTRAKVAKRMGADVVIDHTKCDAGDKFA